MRKSKKKKKSPGIIEPKQGSFFPPIQTKLTIGKADDAYEKEADATADKVVNGAAEGNSLQKKGEEEEESLQQKPASQTISSLQKKELAQEESSIQKVPKEEEEAVQQKEEEEETLQQKGEEEEAQTKREEEESPVQKEEEEEEAAQPKAEEEEKLQKKGNNTAATSTVEKGIKSTKGQGSKMDTKTRIEMEKGFGADFSQVKIHTDATSEKISEELGAQAFTTGNDIYFNEGKYNPTTKEGKHLLAHELTHTIQQTGTIEKKIQKIGIDDVQEEMNGKTFVTTDDYLGIKKGTTFTVIDWKGKKPDAYGSYLNDKKKKILTMFPKHLLKPYYSSVSGVSKYEVGLDGQSNAVADAKEKLDEWRDKESSYKKNRKFWENGLKDLEKKYNDKAAVMSQMLVRETMYNRFDALIKKWVDYYNKLKKPKTNLTYNIVKSIFFQETRLGTSGVHLEKGPYDYQGNPHPIKSVYNLGQVIDSYGPQQYLLIKEMAPTIYKKFGFDQLEKQAKWKGMTNDEWRKAKIFDAIEEFSKQKDASGNNLMGNKDDLMFTYEFWIKATVLWLFEKYDTAGNWPDAVKAYNGAGAAADAYKKAVMDRANQKGTVKVGNN
ncbi:MAG: DUF4157 domain-containing protein [Flavobacteriaceae bacterium]